MQERYKILLSNLCKVTFCFFWAVVFGAKREEAIENCIHQGAAMSELITWDSVIGTLIYACIALPWQLIYLKRTNSQSYTNQSTQSMHRICFGKPINQKLDQGAKIFFFGMVFLNIIASTVGLNASESDICSDLLDGKFFAFIFLSLALVAAFLLFLYLRQKESGSASNDQQAPNIQTYGTQEEAAHIQRDDIPVTIPGTDRCNVSPLHTNHRTGEVQKSTNNLNYKHNKDVAFEKTREREDNYQKKDYNDAAEIPENLLNQNYQDNDDENGPELYIEMGSVGQEEDPRDNPSVFSPDSDKIKLPENKDVENVGMPQDQSPAQENHQQELDSEDKRFIEETKQLPERQVSESTMEKQKFKESIDKKTELMAEMIFKLRAQDKLGPKYPAQDIVKKTKGTPNTVNKTERTKEPCNKTVSQEQDTSPPNITRSQTRRRSGSFPVIPEAKASSGSPQERKTYNHDSHHRNPWKSIDKKERAIKQKKHVTFGANSVVSLPTTQSKVAKSSKPQMVRNRSSYD